MQEMWNSRFSGDDYFYGTEPNSFFKERIEKLVPGKILLLGEGEGRNAVYAAALGWDVDAIDYSEEGKRKAENLAEKRNVKINYEIIDLKQWTPEEGIYDAVAIIFLHLPEELRRQTHRKAIASLKSGGSIIMEVFEKEQLKYNSGGPKKEELLYSLENIVEDFEDLEIEELSKEIVQLDEDAGHSGEGCVIRYVGQKTVV